MTTSPRRSGHHRLVVSIALATVALAVVAGCNASDSADGGAAQAAPGTTAAPITGTARPSGAPGQQRRPGASGLIAEVDAGSMQVQAADSQTTVTWTGTTSFHRIAAATAKDVTVGSCVLAIDRNAVQAAGGGTTPAPATSAADTPVSARTVAVSAPVDGACTAGGFGAGFGGAGNGVGSGGGGNGGGRVLPSGQRPTGAASTGAPMPSGAPGQPGAGPNGQGGFAGRQFLVSGKVTAVSGSTITVSRTAPTGAPGGGSGSSAPATVATVTTDKDTTYTHEVDAKSTSVKKGLCANTTGTADSTGAIAATTVTLSDPVDGSCVQGRGSGGFGGRGRAGTETGAGTAAPTTGSTHG